MDNAVSLAHLRQGLCPCNPGVYRLAELRMGIKKGRVAALPIRLLAHPGAQVALQQSPILRGGSESIANLFPKWDGSMITNQAR